MFPPCPNFRDTSGPTCPAIIGNIGSFASSPISTQDASLAPGWGAAPQWSQSIATGTLSASARSVENQPSSKAGTTFGGGVAGAWKKKGGCGAKWDAGDDKIESQAAGKAEHSDPADYWKHDPENGEKNAP